MRRKTSSLVRRLVTGESGLEVVEYAILTGLVVAAAMAVLAAIGATIGFGHFTAAVAFAILTTAILTGVDLLETSFRRLRSGAYANDDDTGQAED